MNVTEKRNLALKRANEIRQRRQSLRGELHRMTPSEARAVLADAIATTPDWLASSYIDQLLGWLPQVGDKTRERWLEDVELFDRRELRRVTERQRKLLCELLHGGTSKPNRRG